MNKFLTLYTPTYKRPSLLAACLASVGQQTIAAQIEHLVIVDHVGVGVGGMFAQVPAYVDAVHGDYVHILADDDVLASPTVVQQLQLFAHAHGYPPVLIVDVVKGHAKWPMGNPWPPVCGHIDLGCIVTRSDVWKAHAKDYGARYEGDYDFMQALHQAGYPAVHAGIQFLIGGVMRGAPEVAA